MKVTNNTPEQLIAFAWDTRYGYGDDTSINPGETKEVVGPYIGDMGTGSCHIIPKGDIVCQTIPDDEKGFYVSKGNQLFLQADTSGISIRHFSEKRDIEVHQ